MQECGKRALAALSGASIDWRQDRRGAASTTATGAGNDSNVHYAYAGNINGRSSHSSITKSGVEGREAVAAAKKITSNSLGASQRRASESTSEIQRIPSESWSEDQ